MLGTSALNLNNTISCPLTNGWNYVAVRFLSIALDNRKIS